jgi:5-hydroxyisourate hydrolase-like protein (transthyretin family)
MLSNNLMDEATPLVFYLSQNYPNPFKEKTVIKYCVAYKTRVVLTVYDNEGNEIEKLVDEEKKPGTYEVEFSASTCYSEESLNPKDEAYYYRLEAGEFNSEKKMILLK